MVGTHVSALPEKTLQMSTAVNACCRKEYEYTIRDLCEALDGKRTIESVEGLTWRKGEEMIANKDRAYIGDLDAMPLVAPVYKKYLRIEDYFYAITTHPVVTIITGRGWKLRSFSFRHGFGQISNGRAGPGSRGG